MSGKLKRRVRMLAIPPAPRRKAPVKPQPPVPRSVIEAELKATSG